MCIESNSASLRGVIIVFIHSGKYINKFVICCTRYVLPVGYLWDIIIILLGGEGEGSMDASQKHGILS